MKTPKHSYKDNRKQENHVLSLDWGLNKTSISSTLGPTYQAKETALKLKLKAFLECVTQNKQKHSHWLNTLAFLEYIGCRKIIKSQNSADLDLTLIAHISEEARHAFHFKKLAHKVSPADVPNFKEKHTLKGSLAEDYFQAIDHKAEEERFINWKATLNYLYTTWLIEERAIMVYNIYNDILKTRAFPFHLDFILQEEAGHLKATVQLIHKQDPDVKERAGRLFGFEQKQFTLLLNAWDA